jgi:hypothetical protein
MKPVTVRLDLNHYNFILALLLVYLIDFKILKFICAHPGKSFICDRYGGCFSHDPLSHYVTVQVSTSITVDHLPQFPHRHWLHGFGLRTSCKPGRHHDPIFRLHQSHLTFLRL